MKTIHPFKKILQLALPVAGTQLITMASSFLCMTMLATLGQEVLAASALIFSTQVAITVAGMSVIFSLSFLVGHAFGAKDYFSIGSLVQQGWVLGTLIAFLLMFIFWHIGTLLTLLHQPRHIVSLVQNFFYAHTWRVLPLMWGVCQQQLCYGVQKQKIDLIGNVLGIGVLLISAKIFIFGNSVIPALGVAGLGYAMALQAWFYFFFTLSCIYFGKDFERYALFRFRAHREWKTLSHLFKVALPMFFQITGEVLSFFVNSMMVGWIGVIALAAYQIASQYFFLIVVPIFSLSTATGILIGQAYGAKEFHNIKKIGRGSIQITLIITVINAIIFFAIPKTLASLYIDVHQATNAQTLHLVIVLFMITAFSQLIDGLRNVYTGALRGLLDAKFPMIVNLIVLWLIGIPLSYVFAFIFHWGVQGIAIGAAIGMLIGIGVMHQRWQKKIAIF